METINTDHRNQYALITGATSGIGYELASLLAKDGYNLILVARSEELLQQVSDELKQQYGVEITPLAKDLFQAAAPREIYDAVKELGITVNILVNDAGQGEWGPFFSTELERDEDIIQLNIGSLVALTKLFGRDMVARDEGKILQLGSDAGKAPIPLLSVYAATKAFVISFSMALADELKDTNVSVTVLIPGATDTDFFHKAHMEETVLYRERELASPARVAMDGYRALMKGKQKVISGTQTKLNVVMSDIMGDKASAVNYRKQMEHSDESKEEGRTEATHEISRKEREFINKKSGNHSGDYPKASQVVPEKDII